MPLPTGWSAAHRGRPVSMAMNILEIIIRSGRGPCGPGLRAWRAGRSRNARHTHPRSGGRSKPCCSRRDGWPRLALYGLSWDQTEPAPRPAQASHCNPLHPGCTAVVPRGDLCSLPCWASASQASRASALASEPRLGAATPGKPPGYAFVAGNRACCQRVLLSWATPVGSAVASAVEWRGTTSWQLWQH